MNLQLLKSCQGCELLNKKNYKFSQYELD
jgi:hypothetical protein